MKKPLVSILMTIHNHERFLKQSIKSIISQSFKNWELIAIDNGSRDSSRKELKKIKDKRIKKRYLKKNIGRTNCLNYGLKFCKGKFIAILDSDDLAVKDRIKIQLKRMEDNKKLWLTSSAYEVIDEDNRLIKKVGFNKNLNNPRKLINENIIAHSTVMYRKRLIYEVGSYPKDFKYAQDYALYLKTLKKFNLEIIKNKLCKVRISHKNSETFRQSTTGLILYEELKLLNWSYRNFNLTKKEKIKFLFTLLKKILKLIILNYFITIPLIVFFFIVSFFL